MIFLLSNSRWLVLPLSLLALLAACGYQSEETSEPVAQDHQPLELGLPQETKAELRTGKALKEQNALLPKLVEQGSAKGPKFSGKPLLNSDAETYQQAIKGGEIQVEIKTN